MQRQYEKKRWWFAVPPWLIIGAALILAPVFIFMAKDTIDRHERQAARLMVEKGATIIRALEAGVRTGIGMQWGGLQLQKLVMETAEYADIDYLIVTDTQGAIIADSDPLRIGMIYETNLDLEKIAGMKGLLSRQVENSDGGHTFEVYRGFLPKRPPAPESSRPLREQQSPRERAEPPPTDLVVFAGLNMTPVEEGRKQEVRRAIMSAALFLLIGLAGFVSLLLAQGYQAARTSLSRVRAFSDSLVENMPVGLIAFDAEGKVTACNKAAEGTLGIAAAVIGKKAADVVPAECVELLRMADEEKPVLEKEVTCATTEGQTMTLEVISTPLRERTGNFLGGIVIFRDMTEIIRLKEEVARSRRLASLGELAAGVAHEIRNPLSSIKGFATYFRGRFADVPADREAAEVMISEVDRMNRTVTQLIEFARPLQMNVTLVSIPLVIRHALALVEKEAAKQKVSVETEIPPGKWEMPVDADRMTQVFLNLFLNALKAMEAGGVLRVAIAPQDEKIMRITVADTGMGIPAADLPRVFDPYFTTRSSGTGLGLAICHKIVEAHNGEIFLESEFGAGTKAVVILPVGKKG